MNYSEDVKRSDLLKLLKFHYTLSKFILVLIQMCYNFKVPACI